MKSLTQLRKEAGLRPVYLSAKELRHHNPELARKWAGFLAGRRNEIKAALVAKLTCAS
jgi:hypothetical protein